VSINAVFSTIIFLIILATELFKLLAKYRPEDKKAKKERLLKLAEVCFLLYYSTVSFLWLQAKKAGKPEEAPKKPITLHQGLNEITTLVEKKKAELVIIANDVDPIEVCP